MTYWWAEFFFHIHFFFLKILLNYVLPTPENWLSLKNKHIIPNNVHDHSEPYKAMYEAPTLTMTRKCKVFFFPFQSTASMCILNRAVRVNHLGTLCQRQSVRWRCNSVSSSCLFPQNLRLLFLRHCSPA